VKVVFTLSLGISQVAKFWRQRQGQRQCSKTLEYYSSVFAMLLR